MLSAIVLAPFDAALPRAQEAVVRSLAVLVGAAVADLVRDACIVGPPGLKLGAIADHAGCRLAEHADAARALADALAKARCDHVLVLQAGYAPGFGFIDEASDWLARRGAHDAAAFRVEGDGFLQRLLPQTAPVAGLIARKTDCIAARASDAPALARKLRAKTLATRARRMV